MRIVLWLLILPILLFLCALAMLWLPLPPPFPPALSSERTLLAAIVTGVLGAGCVAGLGIYAVSAFLRAGRVLDSVLTPMGMTSERYLLFGRQYRGEVQGRQVEIQFLPARALWPTQLNVYVKAGIGTRMAIGRQRPLLDCRHCARLEMGWAELSGLHVYAEDEGKARRLLDDTASREALARLLDDQERHGLREVYLQPGRVWLRAHPCRMSEGRLRQWLDDLLALAETGEKAVAL